MLLSFGLHCVWGWEVSDIFNYCSISNMSLFSGCFKDFLFIIDFLQLDYDVPLGFYVCILLVVY